MKKHPHVYCKVWKRICNAVGCFSSKGPENLHHSLKYNIYSYTRLNKILVINGVLTGKGSKTYGQLCTGKHHKTKSHSLNLNSVNWREQSIIEEAGQRSKIHISAVILQNVPGEVKILLDKREYYKVITAVVPTALVHTEKKTIPFSCGIYGLSVISWLIN